MSDTKAQNIGIISIGDMGVGIARILIAHGYRAYTYAADRSERTQERARNTGVELSSSIQEFVSTCSSILSIVPPRDALETAKRIFNATPAESGARTDPLYYLDLNAISPASANNIEGLLKPNPNIIYIDGGIIGGPPHDRGSSDGKPDWYCPSLVVSGPKQLPDAKLAEVLNINHLDKPIGVATGLKMCFASNTKGLYALAIESFTTANELGVLPELRFYLEKHSPLTQKLVEKGLVAMPPKAYRWVHEMLEISDTMAGAGGFDKTLFQGVAEVYRVVAEDSELGKEQPGARVRGTTVEDVVTLLGEGMKAKKLKTD